MEQFIKYNPPNFEAKMLDPERLITVIRDASHPVVFTNGCFDILHRGHVTYLAQAKAFGATLIVALNTDESVKRLGKGTNRPINPLANRMAVVASIGVVDHVTYFDEDTPYSLIMKIKPDILVKGGDWKINDIVGSHEVLAYGGQVYSIPFVYNTSTTSLIEKIYDAKD